MPDALYLLCKSLPDRISNTFFHGAAFQPAALSLQWCSGCLSCCTPWGACPSISPCDEVPLNGCSMSQLINPCPPCLSSPVILLCVLHPIMKIGNKAVVNTYPRGTCLLITWLLYFVLLMAKLGTWPIQTVFHQCSFFQLVFHQLDSRKAVDSLAEVLVEQCLLFSPCPLMVTSHIRGQSCWSGKICPC